jgi:hypothetical protein
MNLRQRIQVLILFTLILFAFASYHEGSGNTAWLQWLSVISIAAFTFVFDLTFTNDSQFIFDPDAENWRRKTVRQHFDRVLRESWSFCGPGIAFISSWHSLFVREWRSCLQRFKLSGRSVKLKTNDLLSLLYWLGCRAGSGIRALNA